MSNRFFNTAGPVRPERHYALPPLERFDLAEVLRLIGQQKYFVLHAPRQTGKTTCLLALRDHLNERDRFRCVYVNVETAQPARENIDAGVEAILSATAFAADRTLGDSFLSENWRKIRDAAGTLEGYRQALARWAAQSPRPIVLLLDEVDSLVGDTLISLLRQIRSGYGDRPNGFPQSIILCGVRDVRDYRIHSAAEKTIITGGSAFNVKAKSLRLGDFSGEEVERLLTLHTEETGQAFSAEAISAVWNLTRGQPWLVNALAYEACFELPEGRDRLRIVSQDRIRKAAENLIRRRETHLDQLADKLKEPRVRRVVSPLLEGVGRPADLLADDIEYVRDLGLIRTDEGEIVVANPIYREVIPRELTYNAQYTIAQSTEWYIDPDGGLAMEKLLRAFQDFFREHSEHWVERFHYKQAGPQLLLQAFLQRVVNSGGRIDREYGLGRGRTDLLVSWPKGEETQRIVLELKINHKGLDAALRDGLRQTAGYMDRCGAAEGHLIVFDRTPEVSWSEKIFHRSASLDGKLVQVWGM